MLDQETTEFLIKCANNVVMSDKRWKLAKLDLKLLKADIRLETDWEEALGKSKPTVAEKDDFILRATANEEKEVIDLECQKDYCKMIYDINYLQNSV